MGCIWADILLNIILSALEEVSKSFFEMISKDALSLISWFSKVLTSKCAQTKSFTIVEGYSLWEVIKFAPMRSVCHHKLFLNSLTIKLKASVTVKVRLSSKFHVHICSSPIKSGRCAIKCSLLMPFSADRWVTELALEPLWHLWHDSGKDGANERIWTTHLIEFGLIPHSGWWLIQTLNGFTGHCLDLSVCVF